MPRNYRSARWPIFILATALALGVGLGTTTFAEDLAPFKDKVPETSYEFEMVPIPKGTVEVDDPANPGTKKTVEVGPFWICSTETTWEMFDSWVNLEERAFMLDLPMDPDGITGPTPPYVPPDQGWGHEGYAALTMSYKSARDFCRWISRELGKKYRLPTEAEWQYVCLAGGQGYQGDLTEYAWVAENADKKAHAVASLKPNAWGVYDLVGNVSEWCVGLDGIPLLAGGSYQQSAAELSCNYVVRQTSANLRAWLAQDPQIPQSVWWVAGPTFHGFRIVCEGEATPEDLKEWIKVEEE
jgi:formylglycine-generating enzyme required for sulfatase activity